VHWKEVKLTKPLKFIFRNPLLIISFVLTLILWAAIQANIIIEGLFTIDKLNKNAVAVEKATIDSATEKQTLKARIEKQEKDNAEKQREIIRHEKAMTVVWHYRETGTLYTRTDKGKIVKGCDWITPQHIYKYIYLQEKYQHISDNFNWDTLNRENMQICWGAGGFNFKTDANNKGQNKNGSIDWGIMDINDCNLYLFPDKGKGNDKYDMEKSIEVWHKWLIKQKNYSCWNMWADFRPDVKALYFKLKKVDK
jgi:hypothetical protein